MDTVPLPLQSASRADKKVLLVGAGGLGCPAALALTHAGIGTLGIAEQDRVELSNLHRQILYTEADVGQDKATCLARALTLRVPTLRTVIHGTRLLPHNALELVSGYDLVVEGSDNFATKFLTADACFLAGVPVVHAAAVRWYGTVLAVGGQGRPCYRCLFEDIPPGAALTCEGAGVFGPVVGMLGALQADLALALLEEQGHEGELISWDGKTDTFRRRTIPLRADCPLCGVSPSLRALTWERYTDPAPSA